MVEADDAGKNKSSPSVSSDEGDEKIKIMVVDDDNDVRGFLCALLKTAGFAPLEARNGEEAILLYDMENDTSLVLLDWMMPGMDGMAVLKNLQARDDPPPVLMLTARADLQDATGALREGAKDYMTKPVQQETLLFKINNILERDRDRAQRQAARRKPINIKGHTSFTLVEVSATNCVIESTFSIAPGATLLLSSTDMAAKLDIPRDARLAVRIISTKGKGNRHILRGEFRGLSPEMQRKLSKASSSS